MAKKKAQSETIPETVTPDTARKYLQANYSNRPVRNTWVTTLAGMITRGEWVQSHQGIAFDETGRLVDGQHRLLACVEANKPMEVLVTRDLPEGVYRYIDGGRTRSPSDRLKLMDDQALNMRAVSIMMAFCAAGITKTTSRNTVDLLENQFLAMSAAVTEVAQAQRSERKSPVTSGPVGAGLAAYLDKHPVKGREFLAEVISGTGLEAGAPALLLRDALFNHRIRGIYEMYWKTIAAGKAHFAGRALSTLQAATEDWHGHVYTKLAQAQRRKSLQAGETRRTKKIVDKLALGQSPTGKPAAARVVKAPTKWKM